MPAARCSSDGYLPGQPWALNLQNNTESQNVMVPHHITSAPPAAISFPEMMLVLLKNLIIVKFFVAKMSDLETPTTNSGGRKARPYDGQVNLLVGAGFIPARKELAIEAPGLRL